MNSPGAAVDTGTHAYGPPLTEDKGAALVGWYRPAHTLAGRSVLVQPGYFYDFESEAYQHHGRSGE